MNKLNMQDNKKTHGGTRKGSGRPQKDTSPFFCRVDSSLLEKVKSKHPGLNRMFKDWLKSLV